MNYRFNLMRFEEPGAYLKFLQAVLNAEEEYFTPTGGCLSGRELLGILARGERVRETVLSQKYVEELGVLCVRFHEVADKIGQALDRLFAGCSWAWPGDALPVIEEIQGLVLACGLRLPNVDKLAALMGEALRDMEQDDVYAFGDRLMVMEQYLRRNLDLARQDWQLVEKAWCCKNE